MKKKILLADDEPNLVVTIKDRLEVLGYEVIVASNGKETLEKVNGELPDLVLLDLLMPEMNGYEVCRKLKSSPKTKEIPVIIFTASGQRDLEEKCMSVGATELLRKPFEPSELTKLVDKLLKRE